MMTQSHAARGAGARAGTALCIVLWVALSAACSGVGGERGGSTIGSSFGNQDDAGTAEADDATSDSADEPTPSGPMYNGKPIVEQERDASGSIASSDGYCPIGDIIASYGPMCPSCAQSHCDDAIAECDPTMLNACAEYYCPTQCPLLDAGNGSSVNSCQKVVQCCPTLLGTPLGLTCIGYNANSAQASCQKLLSQAQAMGRCL
jgi:hypothetical protein